MTGSLWLSLALSGSLWLSLTLSYTHAHTHTRHQCIIAGTKGTELPQFSNPSLGLHCAIAPYDEASTRRAFFLTCPEWGPQDAAYHFIKKCWEYWKELGLERQLDRYLSVLLGVVVVPIRADGNCLFRALAKSVMGEEEAHMVVREAASGLTEPTIL